MATVMQGSKLRDRITIEQLSTARDPEYNTPTGSWTVFARRIPAEVVVESPGAGEAVKGALQVASQVSRIRLRYLPGVTAAMRVIIHGKADRIASITGGPAMLGQYQWLEFMVTEVTK